VFTKDAFEALNNVFGTYRQKGIQKGGYQLARNFMDVADLARIINNDAVQSKLRQVRSNHVLHSKTKKNPLKNRALMQRLNPAHKVMHAAEAKNAQARSAARKAAIKAKRSKSGRKDHAARMARHSKLEADLVHAFQVAKDKIEAQDAAGRYVAEEEH